jgi:hypothetical protein
VSKAALDMCLRLMPGAATQQIEEVWQVLPGLNFPPNESQLEQLLKLSAQGVGAWGPDGVGSCLGYLHRLYYLKRNPKMGEEQHKPLPMSLGTALQDLLHCFTQLADSKAAEQEQVISTVSCCGDLQAAPVSLLHLLDTKADALDYSRMGWDDVRVLLAAFGHFGCGMHDQEEQGGMPQPFHLIKRVCDRARQLFEAGGPLPSPHECRNICQSLAYLADGSNAPLLKDLAHRGRFGSSSSSMHQLWRAAQWLLQKLGQRLPASVDMTRLNSARLDSNEGTGPSGSQEQMQHELVLIMRSTGKLIAVSDCEHPLPGTFFKVDACVTNRNGKIIVIEFDGPTHFVAPFGGSTGPPCGATSCCGWLGTQC